MSQQFVRYGSQKLINPGAVIELNDLGQKKTQTGESVRVIAITLAPGHILTVAGAEAEAVWSASQEGRAWPPQLTPPALAMASAGYGS